MLIRLAALLLLNFFLGVQSQGRLFFKKSKPYVTITRYATSTFTNTIFPTCFEVLGTNACARRKKQIAFLVNPLDYYHPIVPHQVFRVEPTVQPEFRYVQPAQQSFYDILSYIRPKPVIEPSFQKAESEGRFFGSNLVTFTTSTTVATTKAMGTVTQSVELNCVASGATLPGDNDLCIISLTFPNLPPGTTLQKFCEGAAKVAKMKLAGFKFVSRRKRDVLARQDVYYTTPCQCEFFKLPGGQFPSRKAIAENLVAFCGTKDPICNIPDVGPLDLTKVKIPGFPDIYKAAGTSAPSGSAQVG